MTAEQKQRGVELNYSIEELAPIVMRHSALISPRHAAMALSGHMSHCSGDAAKALHTWATLAFRVREELEREGNGVMRDVLADVDYHLSRLLEALCEQQEPAP